MRFLPHSPVQHLTRVPQVRPHVRVGGKRVFHFWRVEWSKRCQRHHRFGNVVTKATAFSHSSTKAGGKQLEPGAGISHIFIDAP